MFTLFLPEESPTSAGGRNQGAQEFVSILKKHGIGF
jgi:hypothetical protein